MLPTIPNPYFNRIPMSGPVSAGCLGEVLDLYHAKGANPDLEISPGALDEELAKFLRVRDYVKQHFSRLY